MSTELEQRYHENALKLQDEIYELRGELTVAQRAALTWKEMYEDVESRLEGLGDDAHKDRLLVILQQDLEKAITYLMRYAFALGIQPGGILYDEVQALAHKYKMHYNHPREYSYDELTRPEISPPMIEGAVSAPELTSGPCSECGKTDEHHPECPNS